MQIIEKITAINDRGEIEFSYDKILASSQDEAVELLKNILEKDSMDIVFWSDNGMLYKAQWGMNKNLQLVGFICDELL